MGIEGEILHANFTEGVKFMEHEKENSIRFLLAEFSVTSEQWRHVDRRSETIINIYLTILTAFLPANVLLYRALSMDYPLILLLSCSAAILIIIGVYSTRRLINIAIQRAKLLLALNLIRLYFRERDQELESYTIPYRFFAKPLHERPVLPCHVLEQIYPDFAKGLIYMIYRANTVLAAIAVPGFLYNFLQFTFTHKNLIPLLVVISIFSAFGIYVRQDEYYKRRKEHFSNDLDKNPGYINLG